MTSDDENCTHPTACGSAIDFWTDGINFYTDGQTLCRPIPRLNCLPQRSTIAYQERIACVATHHTDSVEIVSVIIAFGCENNCGLRIDFAPHGWSREMSGNSLAENDAPADGVQDKSCSSYAARASELTRTEPTLPITAPGSRRDFLQALQLLDSGSSVGQVQIKRSRFEVLPVHLSCSHETWARVFGEMQDVDAPQSPADHPSVQIWEHQCTDGPVTCIGHVFERSPGLGWVVLVRVCLPRTAA
jgi:hypothetical protein